MEQFNISDNVDTLFHSLESFTQKEGVIGKPVVQANKTFLPVVSVTVGYGGGNASMGKMKKGTASGSNSSGGSAASGTGASGLGAKLFTDAIIVVDDESKEVQILPMSSSGISQIAEKIPQILQGMNLGSRSKQSDPSQQSES
jgi:uncharacterized spore protein YtfJ